MSHEASPVSAKLTYELAQRSPEEFKTRTLQHLARASVHGARVWNYTVNRGVVDYSQLTLDPNTWMSSSSAQGNIRLGVQPMDSSAKQAILFHPERLAYPDEVSYRLLHEATHSFLYATQHSSATRRLHQTVADIRSATDGQQGLTALGSLPHYKGDAKIVEDTTELMTMYAWSPEYAKEFTDFLADPDYRALRQNVGLANMSESASAYLYSSLAHAVGENLAAA